jgi:hypothetical protein
VNAKRGRAATIGRVSLIGGLALSTPVTLLAIPGLYAAVEGRRA